jgi:hypothetical protein
MQLAARVLLQAAPSPEQATSAAAPASAAPATNTTSGYDVRFPGCLVDVTAMCCMLLGNESKCCAIHPALLLAVSVAACRRSASAHRHV